MAKAKDYLEIDGRSVPVTNLDKILYPKSGFTKGQIIDYYIRVSKWLLPHFARRPVTLKRYPDGKGSPAIWQKDKPKFTPKWVPSFPVPRRAGGTDICYIVIDDLPTLVWCANLASIELHPFLHCVPKLDKPTSVVFDLDPGEGLNLLDCANAGFLLRDMFARAKLLSFPKLSGSKGLQVYVPLNSDVTYNRTQPFARGVAEMLAHAFPERFVADMKKSLRTGKIFVDWSQNSDFKTTVGAYSLRAKREEPYVSMAVTWDELEAAVKKRDVNSLEFAPDGAIRRLEELGDAFARVLSVRQAVPDLSSLEVERTTTRPRKKTKPLQAASALDDLPPSDLKFIEPMQCELVEAVPEGEEWTYELKLDGYRTLAIRENRDLRLLSRRNNLMNERFANITEELHSLKPGTMLDGEVVALDESGRPSFHLLQHARGKAANLVFYVFDVLAYGGRDTRALTLTQRRELVSKALKGLNGPVRQTPTFDVKPSELIAAIRGEGLEGVIAKRASSRYEAGSRSGSWVKYKVNKGQELVIGGYKSSAKDQFENLAAGYYDGTNLIFIAKIKNGFTPALKTEVASRFRGLETDICPFANLPEPKNARRGEALTPEAMKKYRWLRPKLVAQIEFTDWTEADHLRHSKFIALRDDKPARAVHRERHSPLVSAG